MNLTICYITHRRFNCIQWFLDSVGREMESDGDVRIVVVDYYADERKGELPEYVLHVEPKPSVWQGKHRLTTRDYFAAANARNTGLCLAPDGWIAYVDDLSVMLPGWLKCVRQAMAENYMVFGAYRKVLGLEVRNGVVTSFLDHPLGHDARWPHGSDEAAVPHGPGALFGCSLAMPVEHLLRINGWNETCDGMGYEDAACGMQLNKVGLTGRYDRRMMTYESEEMHYVEPPFIRVDKKIVGKPGIPDASHAMLAQIAAGDGTSPNGYDIAELRRRVLSGEPFPIPTGPETHWPDGEYLSLM